MKIEDNLKDKIKDKLNNLIQDESDVKTGIDFFINPNNITDYVLTDRTYAEYFINRNKNEVKYNATDRKWYVWTGKVWKDDETRLFNILKKTNDELLKIAEEMPSGTDKKLKDRTGFINYVKRYQNDKTINGMLNLASKEKEVYTKEEDYNNKPNLYNCASGTIELTSDGFNHIDHKQGDYLTQIVEEVKYTPDADCPYFKAIINQIFNDNQELISFIQRALGYTLTGYTNEDCLFFMYGTGRNGKSTFIEIIKMIFGNVYQKKIQTESLMIQDKKGKTANNDIAMLKGVRFVIGSEIERGRRFAESLIKDLTGGDDISARFLFKEYFTYKPQFKLWIYGNHKPGLRGTDEGIKRRIKLIPFTVIIPEDKIISRDELIKKTKAELPGILNWILDGYKEYKRFGLKEPGIVKDATAEYFNEMDILRDFILIACDTSTKGQAVKLSKLYDHYKEFSKDDQVIKSPRGLAKALRERGFKVDQNSSDNNNTYAYGIIPKPL